MRKFKCKCGLVWFSDEELPVCSDSDDEYTGKHNHVVKQTKVLSADDYAELWAEELENANRHDMTDVPNQILSVLEKNIPDKNITRKIMKQLYNKLLGV